MLFHHAIRVPLLLAVLSILGGTAPLAFADGEGQPDLDEAMVMRLDAKTLDDLNKIGDLLQSALAKGLDKENEGFAKQMLAGVALERGKAIAQQMFRQPQAGNLAQLRGEALKHLETAVDNDPTLAEAQTLIARLNALPGGDRTRALKAAAAAVESLQEDPHAQSEAYMLRALMQTDIEARLADINKAIETNSENIEAYQARSQFYFQQQKFDEAVADLQHVLKVDPTNTRVTATAVKALAELKRLDEAKKILDDGLKAKPDASLYQLRAAIYRNEDKLDEAIADLNKAIELQPRDPASLFARAEIYLSRDDTAAARRDLDKAMELNPGSVQGVLLRAYLSAEEGRLPDAINDMKLLVRSFPENATWAIQLASFYQMDNRPRKAIDVTTDVIRREPGNWRALRIRADTRLSVGEHKEAIADYEAALKAEIEIDDSKAGILNNLAWVMATSPQDGVRDGARSLEMAEQAAKLTEYKQAHILSTLAAAYAETGDFDKALEWSEKAVDLGKEDGHEQLKQLQEELDSYKNKKPWREEQNVEENKAPIFSAEDIIDT
ncbi:tetratricopeptide repeat protein [Rosistilla oblonga]|uniref:tetratricopeptide repeat protein n=1 Tax=Rosistilla oblonga TaxID=2527990 RepID=UPI003A97EC53